jgi:hypothetical protein
LSFGVSNLKVVDLRKIRSGPPESAREGAIEAKAATSPRAAIRILDFNNVLHFLAQGSESPVRLPMAPQT